MVFVTGTFQIHREMVALVASCPQHLNLRGACHGDRA